MAKLIKLKTAGGEYLSPFLLEKKISQKIGKVSYAKNTSRGQFLIETENTGQTNKIMAIKTVQEVAVSVSLEETFTKGVINAKSLIYLTDETLLRELSEQGVAKVERILRRGVAEVGEPKIKEGFRSAGLFVLFFEGLRKPDKIKIGFECFKVSTYYPQPLHCNGCHNWGHLSRGCKKKICGKCAADTHTTANCDSGFVKCPNCSGTHEAWNKNCEAYILEKKIIKHKTDNNVGIHEARKLFNKKKTTLAEVVKGVNPEHETQKNKETPQVDLILEKLTSFCDQQNKFMSQAMALLTEMMGMMRAIQFGSYPTSDLHPVLANSNKITETINRKDLLTMDQVEIINNT